MTIDLDCTMEIIKTPHGSLIFDERYSNKIFLKGLLLAGQSKGRKFKYGYDIQQGTVGRDRTSLEDSSEEPKILANIWREAIASQKKDALVKYVNMLWKQSEWADVNQAENQMSRTTVKAIWDHLHTQILGLNKFYHDDKHGDRVGTSYKFHIRVCGTNTFYLGHTTYSEKPEERACPVTGLHLGTAEKVQPCSYPARTAVSPVAQCSHCHRKIYAICIDGKEGIERWFMPGQADKKARASF